jgi:hypothetical protein
MANCSIPSFKPANGRISTTSSRPSKKQNRIGARYEALSSTKAIGPRSLGFFNAQCSTLNAQRPIQTVESWPLDVGRSVFSSIRRVKGAWWPSRSSKPSLPRKWRGRFDSYPLRLFLVSPVAVSLCETRASLIGRRLHQPQSKGGEPHVA